MSFLDLTHIASNLLLMNAMLDCVMFERIDSVKGFGLTGMCVACLVLIVLADGQHSRRD